MQSIPAPLYNTCKSRTSYFNWCCISSKFGRNEHQLCIVCASLYLRISTHLGFLFLFFNIYFFKRCLKHGDRPNARAIDIGLL